MYVDQMRETYKYLGYPWYEGQYNFNLYAIRNSPAPNDKYDDQLGAVFQEDGVWYDICFPATTKPGLHFIKNPMNPLGCAMVRLGHYPHMYALGGYQWSFKGEALIQQSNYLVDFFDKTGKIYLTNQVAPASSGIHVHCVNNDAPVVGRDSAACMDMWDQADFARFMYFVKKSIALWGNNLSYSLFGRSQVK